MQQAIAALNEANLGRILPDEPLSRHTTWKIGGPADVMIIPQTREQVIETIGMLHLLDVPWLVIGKGSNLLVSDKGIRGAVIKLGPALETLRFEDDKAIAGGSYSFIRLSVLAGKQGLAGLEFAGGIPGTVGGAVYMNAGAHGSDVSRILKQAEVVLDTGELVTCQAADLQYAYRHSFLHERRGIVTGAVFQLEHGDREQIARTMASYKARRLNTQPLKLASGGSVFRNPDGGFAAQLIEGAGLKGRTTGGAEISGLHANFIVNTGNATACDVLALMEQIRQEVFSHYGVELVPEVFVVGER